MASDTEKTTGEVISGNLAVCAFVERFHLFKSLDQDDLAHLYATGRLFRYSKGEVVMREGEPGGVLHLLMRGSVRVTTSSGTQGDVELAQLKRGAVLGEVGVLTGNPRTATVTALDEVEMVAFRREDLEGILRKYPKVRKLLQAMVEGRVRKALEAAKP